MPRPFDAAALFLLRLPDPPGRGIGLVATDAVLCGTKGRDGTIRSYGFSGIAREGERS